MLDSYSFLVCLCLIPPIFLSYRPDDAVSLSCRYHTIHHTKREANFCLFMPLFDLLGGTLDDQSWEMQKQTSAGTYCKTSHTNTAQCLLYAARKDITTNSCS